MSAAERVAHAAKTVRARWERQVSTDPQTEAAQALEDTGQLLDPEVATELVAFRKARELAEVVAREGALPMPIGPVSQVPPVNDDRAKAPWGRGEDGRPLLGPGAHWTDVPEVVDQELARIQGRVDQAQSGHWYVASDTEAWRPAGTVRTNVDGYQRTVGQCTNMRPADLALVLHAHDDLSWCLEMLAKSRARVAELEHTAQQMVEGLNGHDCPPPGESPMEAVTRFAVRLMEADRLAAELEALELGDLDGRVSATCAEPSHPTWLRSATDGRGCPWCRVAELEAAPDDCSCPPADHPHQVGCPLDVPAPGSERPVNELTAVHMPVAVLREDVSPQVEKLRNLLAGQRAAVEDPHDSPLHHPYRLGHDMPVPETCRLDAAGLDEVGGHFLGGAS